MVEIIDQIVVILLMLVIYMIKLNNNNSYYGKNFLIFSIKNSGYSILVTILTTSYLGGGYIFGICEKVFRHGMLAGIAFYGYSLQLFIIGKFFISRIARFKNAITVGEIIGTVYGNSAQFIVGIISLITSCIIVGVQVCALGHIIEIIFRIPYEYGIFIGCTCIILYSLSRKFHPSTITMLLLVIVLSYSCWILSSEMDAMEIVSAFKTSLQKSMQSQKEINEALSLFFTMLIGGILISPCQKLIAANLEKAKKYFIYNGLFSFIICTLLIIVAVLSYSGLESVKAGDISYISAIVTIIVRIVSYPVIKGIFVVCLLAIAISCANSYLYSSVTIFARDIVTNFKKKLTNNAQLLITRWVIIGITLLSTIFAINGRSAISLLIYAYTVWAPACLPILLMTICNIKVKKQFAGISGLLGILTAVYMKFFGLCFMCFEGLICGCIITTIAFVFFKIAELYVLHKNTNKYSDGITILTVIGTILTCIFICKHLSYKEYLTINNIQLIDESSLLPRKNIMKKIDKIFAYQDRIRYVVLVGEGGIGKTTLARNYISSTNATVKWEIDAETEHKALISFLSLAAKLANTEKLRNHLFYIQSITNEQEKKKALINFVYTLLKNTKEWILLFDNVDDPDLIKLLVPISNNDLYGKILITSRNANFEKTNFSTDEVIKIEYLSENEQLQLFENILYAANIKITEEDILKIKNILENITAAPLDISSAANYIKNVGISLEKYIEMLSSAKFSEVSLKYNKNRYKIITTIFDKIIKINPNFKELILLMCLLDSQNIPKNYLEKYKTLITVQEFLNNLQRYSLITEKNNTFSVHRSNQEIGLMYIIACSSKKEMEKYLNKIIEIIAPYKSFSYQYWNIDKNDMSIPMKKQIITHLRSMLVKLKNFGLCKEKQDFYNRQIMLTLLYAGLDIDVPHTSLKLVDEILNLDNNELALDSYNLVALYLCKTKLSYAVTSKEDNAKIAAEKCLEMCKKQNNIENIKAAALAYLARYYITNRNPKGYHLLDESISILDNIIHSQPNIDRATIEIVNQYYRILGNRYIMKKETYKAIVYLKKVLNILKYDELVIKPPAELENLQTELRKCVELNFNLWRAYIKVGDYISFIASMKKMEILQKKCKTFNFNILNIIEEDMLNVEKGHTFLRIQKVKEAYDLFSNILKRDLLFGIGDFFYMLVYYSEAAVRCGYYEKACNICTKAINLAQQRKDTCNYRKLILSICYYNMAIAQYRMNNTLEAMNQFKIFFEKVYDFCKVFLDANTLTTLEQEGKFLSNSSLKKNLENSEQIFKAIYGGENHPFIKDYVCKNAL